MDWDLRLSFIKTPYTSLLLMPLTMATKAAMRPSTWSRSLPSASNFVRTSQRSLTTANRPITPKPRCAALRPSFAPTQLQQTFRRAYADTLSPVTKRRGRGFFRWTWRLTYLSAIGGVGYLAYTIYLLRSPNEQYNPDPSKKTLVILGASLPNAIYTECYSVDRNQELVGAPCLS